MKLLLCSWAPWSSTHLQEAFLGLLTKPTSENKIFFLSIDTTSQFFLDNLEIGIQWYQRLGFTEKNITLYNLVTDTIPSFDELDVLHVGGGNDFQVLKQIRETGLMPRIRDFIERDGVYVGSSAGSKIMGPSIDIELTPDENEVGLQNLTGFGIVPFYIVPHWDSKDDELKEKMLKYGEESGKQVIPLSDQQGILILDNGYEII